MSSFRFQTHGAATRSDRSAGDRQRHRQKVREAIRENIADIISDEAIIGQSRDKIIKVPIRGIKEYRFVYGENNPGAAEGEGDMQRGDVVQRGDKGEGGRPEKAGDQPGEDYYETDITLEELIEIMFEDLELPHMERKRLAQLEAKRRRRTKGVRKKGIRARLDRRRTAKNRVKRKLALGRAGETAESDDPEERFPFIEDDLKYRRVVEDIQRESNAVVICIMDTSGSMDTMKKYLARSFFFLLYQFVALKYDNVEVVFVSHTTEGKEVTEEEFFYKGESGGTFISSGYRKSLEIIQDRYHPSLWNIYAFHASDGDNFDSDNEAALRSAKELCEVCNLFGYGEIKPRSSYFFDNSMMKQFEAIDADNFATVTIRAKEDVYRGFRRLLSVEREEAK